MPKANDRRLITRHLCRIRVPCSAKRITREGAWTVRIRSLAARWVKLASETAYGPGMHLAIDLPGLAEAKLMRIVSTEVPDADRPIVMLAHFVHKLTRHEIDVLKARLQAKHPERKTSLRRPGALKATCHRIRITEDEPWLVTIYSVSGKGIGLLSDQPVPLGTFLKLEIPLASRRPRRNRLVRVTRCLPRDDSWELGGVFLKELPADEVKALLR